MAEKDKKSPDDEDFPISSVFLLDFYQFTKLVVNSALHSSDNSSEVSFSYLFIVILFFFFKKNSPKKKIKNKI